MNYFTIDGNYCTSNLGDYLDYLKEENHSVTSSELQASLDEILDSKDSESVVQISDSTLKAAGEDYVTDNKDKLAAYGVSEDKIKSLFSTPQTEGAEKAKSGSKDKEKSSCCGCGTDFSALRAKNADARSKTEKKIKFSEAEEAKNEKQRTKVMAKIAQAQAKSEALNAQYNALKEDVSAEQEAKQQNNKTEEYEYQKNTAGKLDGAAAIKTQKYQQISEDSQKVEKQNVFAENYKADASSNFTALNVSIDSAMGAHDSSTGYTLAGVNMTDVGSECAKKGLAINSSAITLAERGQNMMNSTCPVTAQEGQQVYERGMALVDTSFDIISGSQDVIDGSSQYYEKSNKYVSNANMFMVKATPTLTNINASNDDIASKINELQSQKV